MQRIRDKLKNADYIIVTLSTVICALLSFVYSVYSKKYIDPYDYGIFSTCMLLENYLVYAQFGVLSAFNRDYPQVIGAGDKEKAEKLRNTTITYLWLIYGIIIAATILIILGIFVPRGIDNRYAIGYIGISIVLFAETTANFCMYATRIRGGYNYSAVVELVRSLISIALGLIFIRLWGFYGLFVRVLIAPLISVLMYRTRSLDGLKLSLDKPVLTYAVVTGLPLMVSSFIYTIMGSIDKFVILGFMDTRTLGIYSVPQMCFTAMVIIPQQISQIFYYKSSEIYGRTKSEKSLFNVCGHYSKLLSFCSAASVVVAFYVLPIFVKFFMPKYSDGVNASEVLIIGVSIYGASMLYGNIYSILKWNKELIWTSVVLCIFNGIFSTGMVMINGRDIINVALGTSISYALYGIIIFVVLGLKAKINVTKPLLYSFLPQVLIIVPALIFYFAIPNIYAAFVLSFIIILIVLILIRKNVILKTNIDNDLVKKDGES